jgi:hypothetical protein
VGTTHGRGVVPKRHIYTKLAKQAIKIKTTVPTVEEVVVKRGRGGVRTWDGQSAPGGLTGRKRAAVQLAQCVADDEDWRSCPNWLVLCRVGSFSRIEQHHSRRRTTRDSRRRCYVCPGVDTALDRCPYAWIDRMATALATDELQNEYDSLSDALRGEIALANLATLTTPRRIGAYRRVIVANRLKYCDTYTGVVLKACIEVHLASETGNRAQVWEPKDPGVWSRLHDLLSPLPLGCDLVEDQPYPPRNREILVPAMRVEDSDIAAALGYGLTRAHTALGVGITDARAVAEAIVAFVENARVHAGDSRIGVLVACAVEPRTNELMLVALDLGGAIASAGDPAATLRVAVARSRENLGAGLTPRFGWPAGQPGLGGVPMTGSATTLGRPSPVSWQPSVFVYRDRFNRKGIEHARPR